MAISLVVACGLVSLAAPLGAQVSSASPAALGMGENYTAAARGLDAVAWNPSALGLRGEAGSSFVTLAVRGTSGLGPVTLGTLADWSNTLVPDGVKRDWLASITSDGGQIGSGGADVTWLALQVGRIAVHASSSARAVADVSPGIAELVLFGNVGQSGQARSLDLSGSSLDAAAWSAIGFSVAQPFTTDGGIGSFGVTVKYVLGHAVALGENSTGATTVDPLAVNVDFPLVHTDLENGAYTFDNGHGIGVDVGASIDTGDWTLSAVVQNLLNSFVWEPARLRYRPLSLRLDRSDAVTQTESVALADAPASVQDRIGELKFEPVYGAGVVWRYAYDLTFTADARFTSSQGLVTGPTRHVGGGFEYRVADWFPLRLGGALISYGEDAGGWQAGAGFGLDLGRWNLAASALRRSAGRFGDATVVMVSLFGAGR